jgi:hypothetical protein
VTVPPRLATERLIALGASNLARMALTLLDAARAAAGAPVEAHAALGRGRSFGIRSNVLGRGLSGIDGCGLWAALESTPPQPTTAIVMDVGNDLLYGVDVERILGWVDAALRRLATHAPRRLVVGLPMTSLQRLPAWRFALVRSVLVPSCRLTLDGALAGAARLHAGLGELAAAHSATFHVPPSEWYGFDPIHVQRRHWRTAARTWLGVAATAGLPDAAIDGAAARLRFLFAAPAERRFFGMSAHMRTTRATVARRLDTVAVVTPASAGVIFAAEHGAPEPERTASRRTDSHDRRDLR